MGVRLTATEDKVALYDSVSGLAFGPVFDTEEEAEEFLTWVNESYSDARRITNDEWSTLLKRYQEEVEK